MKWAIKGNIIFTVNTKELEIVEDGFIVSENEKVIGVFKELPKEYEGIEVTDYGDKIIIPGLMDLHVHAPQYTYRGTGMDLELLEWLDTFTFPEESKYQKLDYAKKAYARFVDDMRKSATTRASVFATIHVDATLELMDLFEKSGLVAYVGKVNMDRNSPEYLTEKDAITSEKNTIEWLEKVANRYENTKPIITPRFVPSCDAKLMTKLGNISKEYNIPNQSHLSENPSEVAWVSELEPESKFYGDAYYQNGLFGGENKTIMAHCVYSNEDEIALMKKQGVYVAHCPASNTNLASGIAPVRRYLDENMNVGLGSDVAGGHSLSMFKSIADAIQVSKLRWRLKDESLKPLKVSEALFIATKGGGSFFGKVGSFEEGYEMDAIVIDDSGINNYDAHTLENRIERIIYLDNETEIVSKYVKGKKLF